MVPQKIQLKKIRDLSDNLSDSFQFIRQEFKPLVKSFLIISGVFLIANSILTGLFQKDTFGFLEALDKGGVYDNPRFIDSFFTPTYFLVIGFSYLSLLAMRVALASYMKLYHASTSSPAIEEVWKCFIRFFPKVLLYSIPEFLLIIIGLIFCLLPGIYLLVVLTPFQFILVFEGTNFNETFKRCYAIIKNNFWISLGIYLIAYIIYSFASGIIGLVVSILAGVVSYLTTKEMSTTFSVSISILNFIGYAFYLVFLVAAFLNYTSIAESNDASGFTERLSHLGEKEDLHKNLEEEY